MLINSLLWIIGRSDDTQTTFGRGNCNSYTDNVTSGGANSSYQYMIPTGNLYNKGQFYGYSDNYHQVKVFHIEGWWGDRANCIHGFVVYGNIIKVSLTGPYNYTGSGYTTVSGPIMNSGGFGSTTMTNEYGRFATAVNGSESTYTCDEHYYDGTGDHVPYVGGGCNNGSDCGASYLRTNIRSTDSSWGIGASLSFV